jgi:sulfur-oxidizing protein SoxY
VTDMNTQHPGLGTQISRRALCAGALSLFAVAALPLPAFATEARVKEAILEDFGTNEIADGNVLIDMPEFTDSGKAVPLSVSVPCTMEGLDYPEVVAVYAARNPRPRIAHVYFTPACSEASFSTRVRIDSFQQITVVVKMASGEIFKGVHQVDVTYGACEDPVANDQFPPGWAPSIRLSVPDTAAVGEAVQVRTIISHPMETGFRYDKRGLIIPVRIVETFRCLANDQLAFSVKLEPAVAANPYFAFNLTVKETSHLQFEWVDTNSDVYSDEATIVAA